MITEDNWRTAASCRNHDPENFYFADPPEGATNAERQKWRRHQKKKFEKAEEICLECPVFVYCGKHASAEDKEWTMRAGDWPTMFTERRFRISTATPEEIEAKRQARNAYEAKRRQTNPEYRARRLENQRKRRAAMTPAERARKNAIDAQYYRERRAAARAAETPEEREIRLAKKREEWRKYSAKKKGRSADLGEARAILSGDVTQAGLWAARDDKPRDGHWSKEVGSLIGSAVVD